MKTPVALIIFNRPDCTARVLESIGRAKPEKLFVIADGPRPDRPDDPEKCAAARAVIDRVDWDCEVLTRFSETNLGCGLGPATGIDWVFEQVEDAIILEDDCLPDPSFFPFCEELLERYRDDERVMMIGAINFLGQYQTRDQSYYFSRFGGSWGWASWRRAWRHFDWRIKLWPQVKAARILERMFPDPAHCAYWTGIFEQIYHGRMTDVWDFQWLLACWINSGYRIFPEVNLISNIGFGDDATHTFGESPYANAPTREIKFPLKHPEMIVRSVEADEMIMKIFSPPRPEPEPKLRDRIDRVFSGLTGLIRNRKQNGQPSFNSEFDREAHEKIQLVSDHTMLPYPRLYSLYHQAVWCEQSGLPGSFVECGTWKGGATGLMALANLAYGKTRRQIHLFDSFESIPEPDQAVDGERAVAEARLAGGGTRGNLVPISGFYQSTGTLGANRELLEEKIGYDPDFLHYHKGWFQDTLPHEAGETGEIAILRLDGDWYASTRVCLEHLYQQVVKGGFVIIDDYGCYEGCRRAVDEFMQREKITAYLHRIDNEARYWLKE